MLLLMHYHGSPSMHVVHNLGQGIDFTAMTEAQQADQEIIAYTTNDSGLSLQDIPFGPKDTILFNDISTDQHRPMVPSSFRQTVFDVVHTLSHHLHSSDSKAPHQ